MMITGWMVDMALLSRTVVSPGRPFEGGDGAHHLLTHGLYLDMRRALRNPADAPALRSMTGLDTEVYTHLLATPGVREVVTRTAAQLRALADEVPRGRLVRLTVACQGGRHRGVDRTTEGFAGPRHIPQSVYPVDVAHPNEQATQRSWTSTPSHCRHRPPASVPVFTDHSPDRAPSAS
nr:hypothetical protein StreXyl84_64730 [Streptomyces sp. Xyl84]